MGMLIGLSGASASDVVLDVACGPGLVACEFAPLVRHVTGIDLTPKMIEQAWARQRDKGLTNLTWLVGDALPLPFPEDTFSIVLTRYSFHHFLDPAAVLREMVRVCRPGGRVMIVDVVQPPEKAEAYDQLEKLRDPSHVHALTFPEMADLIAASGLVQVQTARYKVEGEMEQQLSASFPNPGDEDLIRAMFEADLAVDRLGINVHREEGQIHFAIPILVAVGMKPA
jgi:ubiquinone/menaquinone biosynthesis C-methylase UbiE